METQRDDFGLPTRPEVRRESSCYRPMFALGKEIKRVILHDGERVLHTQYAGWLEHQDDLEEMYGRGRDVIAIDIKVRNARKIDFKKLDNFIVSFSDKENGYWQSGYALYLYVSDWKLKKILKKEDEDGNYTRFVDFYSFSLPCEVLHPELDNNKKLYWQAKKQDKIVIATNRKSFMTDKGTAITELLGKINGVIGNNGRDDLSFYQLEKLLEHFDIAEKGGAK